MTQLLKEKCVACKRGSPPVTDEEKKQLLPLIPEWVIINEEGIPKLDRKFPFRNFIQALEFSNAVGRMSEEEGHHPRIVIEWGEVRVIWWTHKIKNLHRNDFVMAAKTDRLYSIASKG